MSKSIAFATAAFQLRTFYLIISQMQIENLEHEIHEKRKQMRLLEQRIVQSGEASVANASLIDMQQVVILWSSTSIISTFEVFTPPPKKNLCLQDAHLLSYLKQNISRLMTECSQKGFELEVCAATFLALEISYSQKSIS